MMKNMDRLVNVEVYERLESISKLATVVAMEFEPYIVLAMCAERYRDFPTSEALGELVAAVNACATRYPAFQPVHKRLIEKLTDHGHISIVDPTAPDVELTPSIPVIGQTKLGVAVSELEKKLETVLPKSNVINMFSKRKVDNDD